MIIGFVQYQHSSVQLAYFQPKIRGCLGIRKPSIVYKATRIAHLLNMLNHQDINIKFIARHSLKIDMKKREVKHGNQNTGFLGFAVKENGHLDTHVRGGFGVISDWPQLQRLTYSLDLSLSWEIDSGDFMQNGKVLIHHKTDDDIEIPLGLKPRKQIQEIMLQKDLKEFKELKIQGTLADLKDVDYLLSQDIFKNPTWSDSLVQFWYKMKHNVVACNYTLSIWYPATLPICSLDSYRLESMAHLLNGCKEFKDNYS